MNDDELKQLWQQQPLRDVPSAAQLTSAMQSKTSQLRRIVDARDLREVLVCAVMVIVFGCFAYNEPAPIARLGNLIVVGSLIFIAWKLIYTRRSTPPAPAGATVVESLRAELIAVRAQSRLLGSVFWWYLLPGLIGLLIGTWGSRIDPYTKIFCTLVYFAVDWFVYRLNQRARAKELLPVEAQLESLLHSAETGEPLGETQIASLRPLVVSMAAADHVKPVEFKVAFWQLAIYGIPGIVGIWFIVIVSLTVNNHDWKVNERAGGTNAPGVQTEATSQANRYFVVTRKLVDLLNAGDYAAVQRLYNPEMSQFLPPKETTAFFTDIAARYGKIEKFDGPTGNGYRGWTAFRLDCQHGEVTMSLALDEDDKISGFYFRPASIRYVDIKNNIKPFILHLFSWQHLLWGVLSFLGGLIYTWLVQKTVRRAVGISTLGIHLQNGISLILWDEIKEVRPFRFLNIQNLWLFKESGDKTRMHWSPLERHADLKAAVENFAPTNHPIRKYLSLLR